MTATDELELAPEAEDKPLNEYEYVPFIPQGFQGPAKTVVQVLLRAHALLLDEAKWVKQEWFTNKNPQLDPDDPYCNSWQACAAGAVALVSIGSARKLKEAIYEWDDDQNKTRYVSCPVPKNEQQWSLVIERGFGSYVDPPNLALYEEAVELLLEGAREATGRHWGNVPEFNDSYSVSREDVLRALTLAAVKAGKREIEKTVQERLSESINDIVWEATHA